MYSYIWNTSTEVHSVEPYAFQQEIKGKTPLFWREHCIECAMPMCYESCNIYAKRIDGRCLRFDNGITPVPFENGMFGAQISFRRWAKLQTYIPCNYVCDSVDKIYKRQHIYTKVENCFRHICDIIHQYRLCQISASLIERFNCSHNKNSELFATGFLYTVYNHNLKDKTIILEISEGVKTIFKKQIHMKAGWNSAYIPISEFPTYSNGDIVRLLKIYFEDNESGTLTFKHLDFVNIPQEKKPAAKLKCVAWDLDNTLWDGVIGDIGAERISFKEESLSLIKELDKRGILQTIVSKNTYDVVWPFIEKCGLSDYFLYPAINWGRKSQSLTLIAKELNINIDTFALIDDNQFERNEVQTSLPQVRVYDVTEVPNLLERKEFDVTVSEDSKTRRISYLNEAKRKKISASWDGDYDSFLKSCDMKMRIIKPSSEADLTRCMELINRSNQYNISGKRYGKEEFYDFIKQDNIDTFAYSIEDKFGSYGIVGVATIGHNGVDYNIIDFVMSCRVAQKKVERAFVNAIVKKLSIEHLSAKIIKTERNIPLQNEFKGMPFVVVFEDENEILLEINMADKGSFVDDNVINVTFQ